MKSTRRTFAMAHPMAGMAFAPLIVQRLSGALEAQPDDVPARAFDDAGADPHAALPVAVATHAFLVLFEKVRCSASSPTIELAPPASGRDSRSFSRSLRFAPSGQSAFRASPGYSVARRKKRMKAAFRPAKSSRRSFRIRAAPSETEAGPSGLAQPPFRRLRARASRRSPNCRPPPLSRGPSRNAVSTPSGSGRRALPPQPQASEEALPSSSPPIRAAPGRGSPPPVSASGWEATHLAPFPRNVGFSRSMPSAAPTVSPGRFRPRHGGGSYSKVSRAQSSRTEGFQRKTPPSPFPTNLTYTRRI